MFRKLLSTRHDPVLALIRLALGIVFFAHGAQKMLGWFGSAGYSASLGAFVNGFHIPLPFAFLAIMAEFFGGLGLLLGFLTRIAAFGVLCNMLVAVFMVHIHNGFFMNWGGRQKGEGFEFHILAIAMLLLVLVRGAGAVSVDLLVAAPARHIHSV